MATRKTPAKNAAPKKAARKAAVKRPAAAKKASKPAKRVGGRAGTAGKADGDAPILAYYASLPQWQRAAGERFDAIIAQEVPGVRRAIKWSMPFYGLEGSGWFVSFGAFAKHVKFNFFRGTDLTPPPPSGAGQGMRSLDLKADEPFPEKQLAQWIRQASKMPGWGS